MTLRLLLLGLPGGHLSGRERAEAAACMTSCQARGIQNMGTGATVLAVGHNPASATKVDRFLLLGQSGRRPDELPWVLRGEWSPLARELQEARFASFERLLASYLLFHTAAARTRDFMNRLVPIANLLWAPVFLTVRLLTGGRVRPSFGFWDLSRTQSGTRIATTAAPVPANLVAPADYLPPAERAAAPGVVDAPARDMGRAGTKPLTAFSERLATQGGGPQLRAVPSEASRSATGHELIYRPLWGEIAEIAIFRSREPP